MNDLFKNKTRNTMKYNILIIALFSVLFTSCQKDFLDVKSPNLSDNAIFSDPVLFET